MLKRPPSCYVSQQNCRYTGIPSPAPIMPLNWVLINTDRTAYCVYTFIKDSLMYSDRLMYIHLISISPSAIELKTERSSNEISLRQYQLSKLFYGFDWSEVNTPRARQLRWKARPPKLQWANRFIRHCLLEIHRENTRQWMSSIVLVYTYHNNRETLQKTSQGNQSHSFARKKLVSQILLAFFLCICL